MSNDKMREALTLNQFIEEQDELQELTQREVEIVTAAWSGGAKQEAALTQQPVSEPQCSVCDNDGLNCNFCGYNPDQSPKQVPSERGANRFGLDMAYFRNLINRDLNSHSLDNYKPSELARVFARMAAAADRDVLREPEFTRQACPICNELLVFPRPGDLPPEVDHPYCEDCGWPTEDLRCGGRHAPKTQDGVQQ